MLNWLDNFWHRVAGTVGGGISTAVHWAMHALASVVFSVFSNVKKAWAYAVGGITALHRTLDNFGKSVLQFADWLWHVAIPAILRWVRKELASLAADLAKLRQWALLEFAKIILALQKAVRDLTSWVIRDIYDPLKRYADQIWSDLKKWGYTAWWYITHPLALAEVLIAPLVITLEKYAWSIARQLGTFTLALIAGNLPKLIALVEDIITAVF